MNLIGYARVSTKDKNQKLDSQIDQLQAVGCLKIFSEHHTGTWDHRPQWNACLEFLRPGDLLVATELNRISRNSLMIMQLSKQFADSNIELKILNGIPIDTTTPMGRFLYTLLAGLAQLDRDNISERTKNGLATANKQGRFGGRPRVLDRVKEEMLLEHYRSGKYSIAQLGNVFKVSESTVYRVARKANISAVDIQPSIGQLMQAS